MLIKNTTTYNIDYLLRRFKLRRFTKMDSELPQSRTHVPSQPNVYLPVCDGLILATVSSMG